MNGTAQGAAELVALIACLLRWRFEEIARVEFAIAEIFKRFAVPEIGPAARDDIDLAAGGAAEFGAVAVRFDAELLDGFDGRLEDETVVVGIVVVDAVEQILIELFAAAGGVHGEGAAAGEFGILDGRGDAGGQ